MIDISKKAHLTTDERLWVARLLHGMMLEGLVTNTNWTGKDLVFHGGTSIHLVWNSPRHSEDLDFMISESCAKDLKEAVLSSAERIIDLFASSAMPAEYAGLGGSSLEIKRVPVGKLPPENGHVAYDLRWSHPNKEGVVRVKLEFFAVKPEILAAYQAAPAVLGDGIPSQGLRPVIRGDIQSQPFEMVREFLTPGLVIPTSPPPAIFVEKIVALAARPYTKYRDMFDAWWVSTQLRDSSWEQEMPDRLKATMAVYGYDEGFLISAIDAKIQEINEETAEKLGENLSRFMPPQVHAAMVADGAYERILDHAVDELVVMRQRLEAMLELSAPAQRQAVMAR